MKNKIIEPIILWLRSSWGYPFLLLLVGFSVYLYPLTQLGYYWDDWEVVYLTHLASWNDLMGYFWFDRPLAWPYILYSQILGTNPFNWHLLTFSLRFGGILFLYYAFLYLWPSRKYELRWVGLLLIIYPGFLQQSISTAYSRHLTSFFLFPLSLYLTARAVRATSHNWLYWICAFFVNALQIFNIEYYVGLELIRPIFIWFLLEEERWKKLRKTLLLWAPFVTVFISFLLWRIVYYPTTLSTQKWTQSILQLNQAKKHNLFDPPALAQKISADVLHLVFGTWFDKLSDPNIFNISAVITFVALFLGLALAGISIWALSERENSNDQFTRQALLLGAAGLFFGALPVWAIGKTSATGGLWDDRFSQGAMFGAVLLTVAIIFIVVRIRWQPVILSIMLISATVTQVVVVNKYRLDWQYQKDLYWQMYWRAPTLLPNTAIYSKYIPSMWLPDYDASFAFSALYASQPTGTEIPFWFFTAESMTGMKIRAKKPINVSFRNLQFTGNGSNAISILYQQSRGCLRVIDPIYKDDPIFFQYQPFFFSLSNLKRIRPETSQPPNPAIFGEEPTRDWCYFFQKADLARQLRQWDSVIDLYTQAKSLGFSARAGGEYIPFIEAFARKDDFKTALNLTTQAQKQTPNLETLLCTDWQKLQTDLAVPETVLGQVRTALGCSW